jgi:hypothetical protein
MPYNLKIKSIQKVNKYNIDSKATTDQYELTQAEIDQYKQNGLTQADVDRYQQMGYSETDAIVQANQYGYTYQKPTQDGIPIPKCNGPPVAFYAEFDCLVEAATSTGNTRGPVTNYTCSDGGTTFQFLCEVPNSTDTGSTVFTSPTCIFDTASGNQSFYGSGLLIYGGNTNTSYKISVTILHSYLPNPSFTGNDNNIGDYTSLISYDCSNPNVYTYTPGLAIYVDGNQIAKLEPQQAYGGKKDYIHDTSDNTASHYTCTDHSYPYPGITLAHTTKLGTHKGNKHNEIHFTIINSNNKELRCIGNVLIQQQ